MDTYPLSSQCSFSFDLSTQEEPRLKAWRLTLSSESDDTRTYTFPDDVSAGFAAIVWTGNATFESSPNIGCVAPQVVQLTPGDTVSLTAEDGNDTADIAIIGVFASNPSFDDARLISSGKPNVRFGAVEGSISAIFRILELDRPDETVEAVPWPRPAAVLTTLDGPRPVTGNSELPTKNDDLSNQLQLLGANPNDPLGFENGPEKPDGTREQLAIVCDYYVGGDTLIEDGCRWRCWGGGGL